MGINYRKIWEETHGPIPTDSNGRTYEIHHVDGNRNNNDINNLKAVSIKEHYDIHYSQGDWGACLLISRAMNVSPDEKSNLARLENRKRIANRTHHFVTNPPVYKQIREGKNIFVNLDINGMLLAAGKHSSQREESRAKCSATHLKRVADGLNHLVGGEMQRALVAKGIHPLQRRLDGTSHNTDKVNKGTHNFLGGHVQRRQLEEGTHPSMTKISCLNCKNIFSLNTFKRHSNKCSN